VHVARMEREKVHTEFWWENLREPDHLKDRGFRWEDNIKMDLQDVGWLDIEGIDLAQNRDRWQALVIAVTNLRVP